MKKVGVLYTSQSANFAEKIAVALAASGYDSVMLEGGAGARMVAPQSPQIVIWSSDASSSHDILAAARESLAAKTIIPISLGKSPPPAGFEHVWPMDLVGWNHDAKDPRWQFVIDEIEIAFQQIEGQPKKNSPPPTMTHSNATEPEAATVIDSEKATATFAPASATPQGPITGTLFEASQALQSDLGQLRKVGPSEPIRQERSASEQMPISHDRPADLKAPARRRPKTKKKVQPIPVAQGPNGAATIHLPGAAMVAGAFTLLFGAFVVAVFMFAPRNDESVVATEEPPIVAFVEPTTPPNTDELKIETSLAGAPREVLSFREQAKETESEATNNELEAPEVENASLQQETEDATPITTAAADLVNTEIVEAQSDASLPAIDDAETFEDASSDVASEREPATANEGTIAVEAVLEDSSVLANAPSVKPATKAAAVEQTTKTPGLASVEDLIAEDEAIADLIAESTSEADLSEEENLRLAGEGIRLEATKEDAIAELAWNATREEGDPPNAGAYFKECVDCPDMASLPTGAILLGSPGTEAARQISEGPRIEVEIKNAIAFSTHEITFDQWDACAQSGACRNYRPSDAGWGRGKRPVINVSFEDALAFCRWLSNRTGAVYRLPSEAEWEYAARAGTTTPFWFGATLSPRSANYHGEYPYSGVRGIYRRKTTTVASFDANPFGLYDLHGNVWEWTADCWNEDHKGANTDGAPRNGDCSRRIVKGGAWNAGGWRLRVAHRLSTPIAERSFDTGFRVVRELN